MQKYKRGKSSKEGKAMEDKGKGEADLMLPDHDAGIAVKKQAQPEEDQALVDGAYDCLMCFTSCRGQPSLYCTACTWNPWHVACAAGTQFERVCPQCQRESGASWKRGRFTTLQQSGECVDLVAEEEAAEEQQRERELEESRKRSVCVFITAVPITKLFAWGEGDSGGHVLRETTSRGLSGPVCPSRTSERGESRSSTRSLLTLYFSARVERDLIRIALCRKLS